MERIIKLQQAIKDAKKDKKGQFMYLSLNKLLEQVRPALKKLDLALVFTQDLFNSSVELVDKVYIVKTIMILKIIGKEGEVLLEIKNLMAGQHTQNISMAIGSMITYGRRYLLEQALAITGDTNLDPDEGEEKPKPKKVVVSKREPEKKETTKYESIRIIEIEKIRKLLKDKDMNELEFLTKIKKEDISELSADNGFKIIKSLESK